MLGLLKKIKTKLISIVNSHWVEGRQRSGYSRFGLLPRAVTRFIGLDIVILRMPEGVELPPHFDHVPIRRRIYGYEKHMRLNIIVKQPEEGGHFWVRQNMNANIPDSEPYYEDIFPDKRVYWFVPSHIEHGVTKVEKGTRYVLSFGWCCR